MDEGPINILSAAAADVPRPAGDPVDTTLSFGRNLSLTPDLVDHARRTLPYLKTFLENQQAPLTAEIYGRDIHFFGAYLRVRFPEIHHPRELTRHHIIRYRTYLDSLKYAASTINRKLAALSAYFQFLAADDVIERDLFYGVKRAKLVNRRETGAIPSDRVGELLASVDISSPSGCLHHAVLSTLFGTPGLRQRAIRYLRRCDFLKQDGVIVAVAIDKGGNRAFKVMRPEALASVQRYVETLEALGLVVGSEDYVFQVPPACARGPRRGQPISHTALNNIFKRYAALVGCVSTASERFSPHSARATGITDLLSRFPLQEVQLDIGHASPVTTQSYNKRKASIKNSLVHELSYFSRKAED